jgi:hypothetical protein
MVDVSQTLDLSDKKEVLVDSMIALKEAFALGLPQDVLVRSSSPALCRRTDINVEPLENNLGPAEFSKLRNEVEKSTLTVYQILQQEPAYRKYALVAARALVDSINAVSKAMSLTEDNYRGNLAVISTQSGIQKFDRLRNPPWKEILSDKAVFVPLQVDISASPFDFDQERTHPNFFGRLNCSGWPRLGFRVFEKLWRYIPDALARGSVLVLKENQLLRETAYHLALRGFAIKQLPVNPGGRSTINVEHELQLKSLLRPAIQNYLKDLLVPDGISPVSEYLLSRVINATAEYESARCHWEKALGGYGSGRPRIAMTNAPHSPNEIALHHVCGELDFPLASFQHGVAKEIDTNHLTVTATLSESTASDIFFGFNCQRTKLDDNLAYSSGESVAAGLPIEYWRSGSYRAAKKGVQPILFASTQVYSENMNITALKGVSDNTIAASEISLIENVLSQIPYPVLYKPYPEHRYLDTDPALQFAKKAANVTVHNEGKDLTYLLPDARIVILARATSTLSWCLASDKPLVYINYQNENPLSEEVSEALAASIFLFNDTSPTFFTDLCDFFSQSLDDIEKLWRKKKPARILTIDKYFGSFGPGAGKRAASHLISKGFV